MPVLNCKLRWGESVILYRVNWFFRQHYLRRHISICYVSFLSFKSTQYSLALASKRNDSTLTLVDVSFFFFMIWSILFPQVQNSRKNSVLFCFFWEKVFIRKGNKYLLLFQSACVSFPDAGPHTHTPLSAVSGISAVGLLMPTALTGGSKEKGVWSPFLSLTSVNHVHFLSPFSWLISLFMK